VREAQAGEEVETREEALTLVSELLAQEPPRVPPSSPEFL
jgi:hypothetical protein